MGRPLIFGFHVTRCGYQYVGNEHCNHNNASSNWMGSGKCVKNNC